MLDGKLTLVASIDARGKTTCAIPIDDTGLTQEVEDCMSARFTKESFEADLPWAAALPIAVRGGKVVLGAPSSNVMAIESVETHRMPDAFDTLEALVPDLLACARDRDPSAGVRGMIVGARVATDGRTQCAVATATSGALPAKTSACATGVFERAKFPPPKGGTGLVLVPVRFGPSRS